MLNCPFTPGDSQRDEIIFHHVASFPLPQSGTTGIRKPIFLIPAPRLSENSFSPKMDVFFYLRKWSIQTKVKMHPKMISLREKLSLFLRNHSVPIFGMLKQFLIRLCIPIFHTTELMWPQTYLGPTYTTKDATKAEDFHDGKRFTNDYKPWWKFKWWMNKEIAIIW